MDILRKPLPENFQAPMQSKFWKVPSQKYVTNSPSSWGRALWFVYDSMGSVLSSFFTLLTMPYAGPLLSVSLVHGKPSVAWPHIGTRPWWWILTRAFPALLNLCWDNPLDYTETEKWSGWQPWYSLETLKLVFNVSSEYQGCHPDDLSVSV